MVFYDIIVVSSHNFVVSLFKFHFLIDAAILSSNAIHLMSSSKTNTTEAEDATTRANEESSLLHTLATSLLSRTKNIDGICDPANHVPSEINVLKSNMGDCKCPRSNAVSTPSANAHSGTPLSATPNHSVTYESEIEPKDEKSTSSFSFTTKNMLGCMKQGLGYNKESFNMETTTNENQTRLLPDAFIILLAMMCVRAIDAMKGNVMKEQAARANAETHKKNTHI